MNPTQLRRIAQKYGTPGVLAVGAILLCQSLWRRKPLLLASLGALAIAVGFVTPMTCTQGHAPVAAHFDTEAQGQVTTEVTEEPLAYRIVDLGALPGGEISEATGISDKGHISGISEVSDEAFHGFFWDGKMRDIGTLPGGEISVAFGVNNSGQVVGIGDDRQGMVRGFLWEKGKIRDVGHLGGGLTLATGLNNRGGVVGISATKDYLGHAFIWQDGKIRDIGTPKGCDLSIAQDVNDSGTVVGTAVTEAKKGEELRRYLQDYPYVGQSAHPNLVPGKKQMLAEWGLRGYSSGSEKARGFVWKNGKFTELRGKLGETLAVSINNKGQVVGVDFSEAEDKVRAMLWESEQGKELPLPSGYNGSFAIDIADDGAIVGFVFNDREGMACMWKNGKVHDLSKLLPSGSGWDLWFADSINAKGQIVGIGEHNGQLRAFLLSPK